MFTVIYRTGGTDNFQWKRIFTNFTTMDAAKKEASEIEKMGYLTIIHKTALINAIGLPETYDAKTKCPN